ncbi:MAG: acyclic terpene utilization AtuA family protein [Acidimicrobiales bacterium]
MTDRRPVRIANCSGFYGDRLRAAREMIDGGPIDVLTGDYLAELTMMILWKAKERDPSEGYARTFLTQMEDVLGDCIDRGIKVVTNAGGLAPGALTEALRTLSARLGLTTKVAWVDGDNLIDELPELMAGGQRFTHLDTGQHLADAQVAPITANAYLGGFGIAEALSAGADVVVCGRVTDASLVVGPAVWWHEWSPEDYDALAGAVVAGHVIECGPQATGGNYSFLNEVVDRRYPGFPIAEVASNGSSVITKHEDTGGLVSVGTVTSQLLYEIAEPAYANPDVVAHFDSIRLTQIGSDRVQIDGVRGTPPPETLKVALNYLGGYRNAMTLVLTGLDIEEKASWAEVELFEILGGKERFEEVDVHLSRFDQIDAPTNELATAHLRITVMDRDPKKVGRAFSNATMELALGGYPGFHTTTPPSSESAFGVYWPTTIPADLVRHRVVLPDGTTKEIPHFGKASLAVDYDRPVRPGTLGGGSTTRVPLGRLCGARSGDKGGNANVGLFALDEAAYAWLSSTLDVSAFRELLPEASELTIRRYELPNLWALNFVIVGLLGRGVASSVRPDPQAKGLGEYLRSRYVEVPTELLP